MPSREGTSSLGDISFSSSRRSKFYTLTTSFAIVLGHRINAVQQVRLVHMSGQHVRRILVEAVRVLFLHYPFTALAMNQSRQHPFPALAITTHVIGSSMGVSPPARPSCEPPCAPFL